MKNILFTLLFLASSLFAQIEWLDSYDEALKRSRELDRPILLLMVSDSCGWCRKLKEKTLQNPEVENYINRRYVPLMLNRERDEYPSFIKAKYVPTTFYIDPDGKLLIDPVVGYWEADEYMSDLRLVLRVFKRRKSLHR